MHFLMSEIDNDDGGGGDVHGRLLVFFSVILSRLWFFRGMWDACANPHSTWTDSARGKAGGGESGVTSLAGTSTRTSTPAYVQTVRDERALKISFGEV